MRNAVRTRASTARDDNLFAPWNGHVPGLNGEEHSPTAAAVRRVRAVQESVDPMSRFWLVPGRDLTGDHFSAGLSLIANLEV